MKHYIFGYLFVRFAKIIAVLVLVGGAGGAIVHYFRGTLEAASVRYEPGRQLGTRVMALSGELDRTRKLVTEFMGRGLIETTPLQISKTPDTVGEFEALHRQLAGIQTEREALKNTLVQQFENSVGNIERKLRAHASSLTEQQQPSAKRPQTTAASPSASGSNETTASKKLFAPLDRSELALRRDVLNQSLDFLSVLQSSAENPDNQKILTQAVVELEHLRTLLPVTLEVATPPKPPKLEPESPAPPVPKLNAERVADQLQQVCNLTRAALLTEWSIDHAFDQAATEVDVEQKRCLEAERALKRLWLSVSSSIVLLLVASVITAFLILVLADLTQALLDAATNSGLVASVYQNSGAVEEG